MKPNSNWNFAPISGALYQPSDLHSVLACAL